MGTNYYLKSKPCPHCGKADSERHIGKSSGGWHFSLHVYPEDGIQDLPDWIPLFADPLSEIRDEYDVKLSAFEMREVITARSWERGGAWTEKDYADNHAEPGTKGLVRHKLDGLHCIKNGVGTWDCIVGEFS